MPRQSGAAWTKFTQTFPDKPIVLYEYGYCACTAERPEGDERQREILRSHDAAFREQDYIAGLIFFCYNDYRTHIGGAARACSPESARGGERLGNHKPSYELLREESSPIASCGSKDRPRRSALQYKRGRTYLPIAARLPLARYVFSLRANSHRTAGSIATDLKPGSEASLELKFAGAQPEKIQFEVLRPTGFSACTRVWKT